MAPYCKRMIDVKEDNVQAPLEMPPLETSPIQLPLVSRTDFEVTHFMEYLMKSKHREMHKYPLEQLS